LNGSFGIKLAVVQRSIMFVAWQTVG